jgi:hypothetical protein
MSLHSSDSKVTTECGAVGVMRIANGFQVLREKPV